MISGVGIDVVEIDRIQLAIDRLGERFLKKIYTPFEISACSRRKMLRLPELAVRFAAKEAYMKAIGTGMRGIFFKQIEVRNDPRGKPYLVVPEQFPQRMEVSLSHSRDYAVAVVIVEKE